jgi:hypothetical protein
MRVNPLRRHQGDGRGSTRRDRRPRRLAPAVAASVLAVVVVIGAASGAGAAGSSPSARQASDCKPHLFARCPRASLTLADLGAADLRGADLRGADLNGAFLHSASLAGSDLRGADLRATTLVAANLRGSNLRGADLADANLDFARVRGDQLAGAYLCRTRLPAGELSRRDCDRSGPALAAPAKAAIARTAATNAPPPHFARNASPLGAKSPHKAAQRKRGGKKHKKHHKRKRKRRAAVNITVVGGGEVIGSKGSLHCPTICAAKLRQRAALNLVAVVRPGARFIGWSGACSGNGTCAFRVRAAKRKNRVTATFTPAPTAPSTPTTPSIPLGCQRPPSQDTDGDGIPDCVELAGWNLTVTTPQGLSGGGAVTRHVGSNPDNADTDGDGAPDGDELRLNSDPRSADTDGDGLDDRTEIRTFRTLPNDADTDNDSVPPHGGARDSRLFDGNEVSILDTNPRVADTDGDSISDFNEVVDEHTNPRVPDLPQVDLTAVPGLSNPQLDLDYTVENSTGADKEHATTTERSNSTETSSETSRETTNAHTFEYQASGGCNIGIDLSCSVHQKFTNSWTDSITRGSTSGFSNTQETTNSAEQVLRTSAERSVELGPTGCMQVVLRLHNSGPVSVSVGNLQVLALTEDPVQPNTTSLLAALLPINGQVVSSTCPATEPDFGPVELPPGGSSDVAFSQLVDSQKLLDYMKDPTPIQYELGPITMTGTNLDGVKEDFLGQVASKVHDRTASVEVNFPDGTIDDFLVAAGTRFNDDGTLSGVTLGEALGAGLGDLAPQYTSGTPSKVEALRNPDSGTIVANASDLRQGVWTLFGDGQGVGSDTTDWRDVVLRPGNAVSLYYSKDADLDGLPNDYEAEVGTDPQRPDTDDDGLTDQVETQKGWTVPFARDGQSEYKALPSPLSCDGDGDTSPDGTGPGNTQYGFCPTGQGPESTRFTDPTLADTNFDTVLDGDQPLPDALRAVPLGGRVPELIRHWGGPGELGGAQPTGIAVDGNQPVFDSEGKAAPIDSYVIARLPAPDDDEVYRFTGNPRAVTPFRTQTELDPQPTDFAGNPGVVAAATGIAVAPGSVGTGDDAGSPVIVNYYPKTAGSITDPNQGPSAFTTFNGNTGDDLLSSEPVAGSYGGSCCFLPPAMAPGEEEIGNGFIDLATPLSLVVAHGRDKLDPLENWGDQNAVPTRYRGGDITPNIFMTYGQKPPNTAPDNPGSGQLNDPSGIAIDHGNGKLYVADDISSDPSVLRGTLTRYDLASGHPEQFVSTADGSLAKLRGLAVDPNGQYIYAASDHCNVVYKLSTSLSILGAIGGSSCTDAPQTTTLQDPSDVDVDAANGVWVTDAGSQLINFYFYPFGP